MTRYKLPKTKEIAMTSNQSGAYGADNTLVDYILGITYEIWEERKIQLIKPCLSHFRTGCCSPTT